MRFDQAPLGGASKDLPTDDLAFECEEIARQAEALARGMFPDSPASEAQVSDALRLIASLARALSRKGVANV